MTAPIPIYPGTGAQGRVLQVRLAAVYGADLTTLPSPPPVTLRHPALDGTASFDPSTAAITLANHRLANGTTVQLRNATAGGLLPALLDESDIVYVVAATASTFQVAQTLGGAAIAFADAGTGTTSVHVTAQLATTISPGGGTLPAAATSALATLLYTFTATDLPRHGEYNFWTAVVTGWAESTTGTIQVTQR